MKDLSEAQIKKFIKIVKELEEYQKTKPSQLLRMKGYGIRSTQVGALILFLIEKKII